MDDKTYKISAEYDMIRREIESKMALHNTLLTFTITTSVAVLALVIDSQNNNAFLFLLPFCIIIPMSTRIAYYRNALAKLSAYLIVFCEVDDNMVKWESRNFNLELLSRERKIKKKFSLKYNECLFLGIACYLLFLFHYIPQEPLCFLAVFNCLWPSTLLLAEVLITSKINNIYQDRLAYIISWHKIKEEGDHPYAFFIKKNEKTEKPK